MTTSRPHKFVEHFFRRQWRNVMASLTSQFGVQHLDGIENAVQAAMTKALHKWAMSGIPENPGGWIYQVARNEFLDEARKQQTRRRLTRDVADALYAGREFVDQADDDPLNDDVLRMILVCCHPVISARDSVILTLRVICGLGFGEIAAGLCMSVEAVRKRLTRCRADLAGGVRFMVPPNPVHQRARLGRALRTIYLLFNEGYFASQGDAVIRDDLCREAERLMQLLRASSLAADGRIWALSSLLAFQASRLSARVSDDGRILLLYDQDRTRWDHARIADGFSFLQRSMSSSAASRYHLEAAIAACHASAPSYADTDWTRIIGYYDALHELTGSPVVLMNRAVAVMELEGPEAAVGALTRLKRSPELKSSFVLSSVLGECHKRLGQPSESNAYFQLAIRQSSNKALAAFWSAPDRPLRHPAGSRRSSGEISGSAAVAGGESSINPHVKVR